MVWTVSTRHTSVRICLARLLTAFACAAGISVCNAVAEPRGVLPGIGAPHFVHSGSSRPPLPAPSETVSPIVTVGYPALSQPLEVRPVATTVQAVQRAQRIEELPPTAPVPAPEVPRGELYPIDLATALRLAGANNLQIALAGERVREARARLQGARALWIPSLYAGAGYNRHDGQIQDTRGEVIDTGRSSLFVGGGPALGTVGVAGASAQPRLVAGLPLADVLFAPLAERQFLRANRAAQSSTFNDTLLQVALSYENLVQTQAQVGIADEALQNAKELLRVVDSRVRAGTTSPADGLRIEAEVAERRRQRFQADEQVGVSSAELVRLTRLDGALSLVSIDDQPLPIDMVPLDVPLPALVAQGITSRPELAQNAALVNATLARLRHEQWRPLAPTVQLGVGGGGFGGGVNSFFGDFSGRTDFDALAVWEIRNLGFGNRALQRERRSQHFQAHMNAAQVQDNIAAEVVAAYYRVQYRRRQIDAAQAQVKAAAEAFPLNIKGILGGDLRPIEGQQAISALVAARGQYLASVIDYNRAQFELVRAMGQPPEPANSCP